MNLTQIKRIILPVLIVVLILFACSRGRAGEKPAEESPDLTVTPTVRPVTITPKPTVAPTPTIYYHPLTGRELTEPFPNTRPWAISINNIVPALQQCSIEGADIIFEVLAEGATRMIALYSSLDDVGKIGSIRSVRPYFIDITLAYDAILVHGGASEQAYSDIRTKNVDNLDGVNGDSSFYYREPSRANRSLEHTLFIKPDQVLAYAEKMQYRTEHDDEFDYGLSFTEDAAPEDGEIANTVSVLYDYCGKTTNFTYSEEDDKYYMRQYNLDYIDENTGNKVGFENVLVLYTKATLSGDYYGHVNVDTTGTGDGYFICGGKYEEITWSRNPNEPYSLTGSDGNELKLNVGTTFVCLPSPTNGTSVTFG